MATITKDSESDKIGNVTSSTFNPLVLEGVGEIVVEFMSYGCSHCHAIEPILQQVAATMESRQKFFRVNIAVEPEIAESYQVEGTPTLVMFLNGLEVGRVEGPIPTISGVLAAVTQPYKL